MTTKHTSHPAKHAAHDLESPAVERKQPEAEGESAAASAPKQTKTPAKAKPRKAAKSADVKPAPKDFGLPKALNDLANHIRVTVRREGAPDPDGKCVVYWMQRAERGIDNHAVNIAVEAANELGLPLVVYFAGISNFPHANLRHYAFLNQGLIDVEHDLAARNISFVMRRAPHESHEQLFADVSAAMVIGDENPMREPERWRAQLAKSLKIPFWTVDADVVVPSKLIEKAQYGAYTIRPRLLKLLPEYLVPYDNPHAKHAWKRPHGFHADGVHDDITRGWTHLDRSVPPVQEWPGGTHAAYKRLDLFVREKLKNYETDRNKPEIDGSSCLSPYLHFGHISAQAIALAVTAAAEKDESLAETKTSFLNELIIWRELSVNFVRFSKVYDTPECAEDWARKTIAEHARDERETIYTTAQMERGETHDEIWNAAQWQGVYHGWMHNFLRMYWGKKILEWTPDVDTAMKTAIYLNDKYFLDGRDPGGYAGIAWAIVGKFDRAWGSRPIFGKRRFMSGASTGKKFNSKAYIQQMKDLRESRKDVAGKAK